ncbi:MAG: proton-conducting transporter membrane subunit [Pirellulaceae bacterium]
MTMEFMMPLIGAAMLGLPAILILWIGLPMLLQHPWSEQIVSRSVFLVVWLGLGLSCLAATIMIATGTTQSNVSLGSWYSIPSVELDFKLDLILDGLSLTFVIMSFVLCGTISAFATKYLHKELGFQRFFLLFAMFLTGIVMAALAGTIELLFVGWELVGLSSALLVAFFHERLGPVKNGLRVWAVYRVADAAFLAAAATMHHMVGHGDFAALMPGETWPNAVSVLTQEQAIWVGLLLLLAAMGKSALVPFSGWLPRAMEGPTPSSAIFYGALSVHLGAYLLLRISPILQQSTLVCLVIIGVGATTALFAAITARVQSDIKSALSFASLTQVGLIVIEIGLGWELVALIHIVGHACFRTLQLLRAPTLLHDYHTLENAVGGHLTHLSKHGISGSSGSAVLYRWGLERGYLDFALNRFFVNPVLGFFRRCHRVEQAWANWCRSGSRATSEGIPSTTTSAPVDLFEELP